MGDSHGIVERANVFSTAQSQIYTNPYRLDLPVYHADANAGREWATDSYIELSATRLD